MSIFSCFNHQKPIADHSHYPDKKHNALYTKWEKYGFPMDILNNHPEFVLFMEKTGLLSQMKITKDVPCIIDGKPALLVEGEYMSWDQIEEKFEVQYARAYSETFIIHRESRDVYTYLANGKGLQPHHPYRSDTTPVTVLSEDEYKKTFDVACNFVREEEKALSAEEVLSRNQERPFIVQIVSSYVKGSDSNFSRLVTRSKHPYLRIIIGKDVSAANVLKGEVYEVGYGWEKAIDNPFKASGGRFRSPDIWEYKSCEERVVTNIPVSQEEARKLRVYTKKYHLDGLNLGNKVGFNLLTQNCSTYIAKALEVANINVPVEISLPELIGKIAPNSIANTYKNINKMRVKVVAFLRVPEWVRRIAGAIVLVVKSVFSAIAAFILSGIVVCLRGRNVNKGQAFGKVNQPRKELRLLASKLKQWFSLSSYKINLPGVLQEWQRQQASTVVYKDPIKLVIVP